MPRNVSNSEVSSWLACRQQYLWGYYRNLTPKTMATQLFRGGLGHEAFQRYSEARIGGKDHEAAMRYADEVFTTALKTSSEFMDTILQTRFLFTNYMGFHQGWPNLKILSVEQKLELPLNESLNITIRYDTLVEERTTGKRGIGDYKFTYDFWTPEDHQLNGQMPKYISVLQGNGYHVDFGFLEEIRTRKLAKENQSNPKMAWKRTTYAPSAAKKKNMLRQHVAASLEIDEFWKLSDKEREAKAIPVLNQYGACKFCDFREPCASKLDGGDVELILQTAYVQNTYGYNEANEAARLAQEGRI